MEAVDLDNAAQEKGEGKTSGSQYRASASSSRGDKSVTQTAETKNGKNTRTAWFHQNNGLTQNHLP